MPIFSELLHVSVEQILSAGKCGEPILNPDEYGKTVLDYAIMFGNYDFLKFLANKNYIWFDSRKDNDVFVFPYISQLLDMLIENNSPFLKTASEKSIEHNESTKELSILQKRS